MQKSEQLNELATALAKAQGQLRDAKKDASNPFFKVKYADLASCWDACRKPLSDNGLSVVQTVEYDNNGRYVETMLLHTSGQFITSCVNLTLKDDNMQAVGSAITYARRYSLAAIVGISPDDDDAEAASGRPPTKSAAGEIIEQKAEDKTHYCSVHNVDFFKKGKMPGYAHKTENGEWCNEIQVKSDAKQAEEDIKTLYPQEGTTENWDWIKEKITLLESKGIKAWGKQNILSYLNTMTGKENKTIKEAVGNLDKQQTDEFIGRIKEAVEML